MFFLQMLPNTRLASTKNVRVLLSYRVGWPIVDLKKILVNYIFSCFLLTIPYPVSSLGSTSASCLSMKGFTPSALRW